MGYHLEVVDCGGAAIFPEQNPKNDWKQFFVFDACDKEQFTKEQALGPELLQCADRSCQLAVVSWQPMQISLVLVASIAVLKPPKKTMPLTKPTLSRPSSE